MDHFYFIYFGHYFHDPGNRDLINFQEFVHYTFDTLKKQNSTLLQPTDSHNPPEVCVIYLFYVNTARMTYLEMGPFFFIYFHSIAFAFLNYYGVRKLSLTVPNYQGILKQISVQTFRGTEKLE